VGSVRSLISYLSPYVRSLELRIEELNAERIALQNRLLHAYSGYELRQPVPSYAEVSANADKVVPGGDAVIGAGNRATVDILQALEDKSWEEAEGVTGLTAEAARQRAQEEFDNNAKEYEERLIKAKQKAAADSGMPPV
jgi:hypothetical protein